MTLLLAMVALAAEPQVGDLVIGKPRPATVKTSCVPAGGENWRCVAVPLELAKVPGNVAIELCGEVVHRVSWVTLVLPGGHAVPGSVISQDIQSDTKAAFDKVHAYLVGQGFKLPDASNMGSNQVQAARDGVKVGVEMGPVPPTPMLPAGSWQAGLVMEREVACPSAP